MDVAAVTAQIVAEAVKLGGATWTKIQQATPLYIRGYLQSLADIASGVVASEITKSDAKMYVQNARLLLMMGIANTCHIILVQVQSLMDSVLRVVKGAINAALPIALL